MASAGRNEKKRRRRPKRSGRLTREGKAFVFVTVGVGVAAVNTGNNLLYLMLGLMLSLLLLSMVLSEVALSRVRVRRRLPLRAFAHTVCLVEIGLRNDKRWVPSFSLEVEDRADDKPAERRCYFLKVGANAEQVAIYRRTPERRGILQLVGFRVATRYPFGLVEKGRYYEDPAELLVYPQLVTVAGASWMGSMIGEEVPLGRIGPGVEIAGLRDYHPGDVARAIHWRRTASLGRLVIRERERDAAARVTLVLDNRRGPGVGWDDAFEAAVSRAASLAANALVRGTAVEVATRSGSSPLVIPGSPPDPIFRFLALLETVEPDDDAPPLPVPRGAVHVVSVESVSIEHESIDAAGSAAPERAEESA